jgi:hypothetical protein
MDNASHHNKIIKSLGTEPVALLIGIKLVIIWAIWFFNCTINTIYVKYLNPFLYNMCKLDILLSLNYQLHYFETVCLWLLLRRFFEEHQHTFMIKYSTLIFSLQTTTGMFEFKYLQSLSLYQTFFLTIYFAHSKNAFF